MYMWQHKETSIIDISNNMAIELHCNKYEAHQFWESLTCLMIASSFFPYYQQYNVISLTVLLELIKTQMGVGDAYGTNCGES